MRAPGGCSPILVSEADRAVFEELSRNVNEIKLWEGARTGLAFARASS